MASLAVISMVVTTAVIPDPNVTVSYPSCLDNVSYFNVTAAIVPNSNILFRFISLGMKNPDNTVDPYAQCSSGGTGSTYTNAGATMFAFIQTKCDPIIGPDFKQPFYLILTLRAIDPMQAKNAFNTNLNMRFGFVKPNSNIISVTDSRGPPIQRIMAQCQGSDADRDQAKNAASGAASQRRAIVATALGATALGVCALVWR